MASLSFTCAMIGFGVGNVVMGRVSDRVGIQTVILVGNAALAGGYIAAGYVGSQWQFNIVHIAMGLGAAATFGPLMAEASQWFEKYRGFAVAIAASGNYIAGTIWPPVVERGIAWIGWRSTHILLGVCCSLAMTAVLMVLRRQMGGKSAQVKAEAPPPRLDLQLGNTALTALLGLAAVSCCVAMAMPQVHIVAYCGDLGYGVARGAEMLSLMLGLGIVSRVGSGFLADKIGGLRILLIGSVAQAFSLVFYMFFDSLTSLYLISAMFGLFQGGIVPAYAIIIREHFPPREAGSRVGTVIMFTLLGMALGGWMSGKAYDLTGSYTAAFVNGIAWNALNLSIALYLFHRAHGLPGGWFRRRATA